MASTYSPNLRLELIGTGDQQGTWGATTNTNLGTLLEEAIGGYVSVTVTDGADTQLTALDGTADQSRNMVINLTGLLSASRNVICPAIEKVYIVKNATTGGYAVTFKVSGQTGVSIPNGATVLLYVNGSDAFQVGGDVVSGGTGITSYTVGDLLYASGTTTLSKLADVATGNALISGGVGVAPSWGKVGLTTHVSGTLPVANGGTGVTSSTGSGSVVLSSSPVLTTPNLGTPSAVTLTNANGLPLTSGVTGTLPVTSGGTGVTSISGIVKGNGSSSFSAATAGVDYVVPSTLNSYLPLSGGTMSGALGIGATPTDSVILATGNAKFYGVFTRSGSTGSFGANAYNIFWTGSAARLYIDSTNVGTISLTSDYRIKKDVAPMSAPAIDRIMKVKPITYQYKDNPDLLSKGDGVSREGFVAHELAAVIPSAVDGEKDSPNQIQSLRLDALCAVLVKAIQEQQAQIDALKARLS